MRSSLPAVLLAVAVAAMMTPAADGVGRFPELEVSAPDRLAHLAREIEVIAAGDFGGALALTGLAGFAATPITVVIAGEDEALARNTPAWVSGFADARNRTIVLFPARVSRYPDDNLTTLVHHEVVHLLVAEAAAGRPVPRWFNEGVATVAAREWGIEDAARYVAAVIGRGPKTTAELDRAFVVGGPRVSRAYALSSAFIRWMQSEYGGRVTARILELVSSGAGFREAFVRATGDTLERAERAFFVRQALWHTWIPVLTSSGLLWAGITVLALVAFRRRRQRSAAMRERWQAEETAESNGKLNRNTLDDRDDDRPVN